MSGSRSGTAVVILNWNGRAYLERFLPYHIRYDEAATVVVADNKSSDDSVSFLRKEFPSVHVILNEKNFGFARGYNEALKHVNAEYFILINSDVEVTPGWIDPLISFMERNPQAGACQPKILDYNRRNLFEYAGAAGGYIDRYGFPFCRGRIFGHTEEDRHQYDDVKEIFWATGACMVVRAGVFHEARGFDDDFFAHMEEIDLCWRIRNMGYSIYAVPSSVVYHIGGGTLHKSNPRKTYLNFRNNLAMLIKNTPGNLFLTLIGKLLFDGLAGLSFLARGSFRDCLAVIKAHFYIYFHFGKVIKKRKQLKVSNTRTALKGMYPRSIVKDYFLKKRKTFSELDWNL
jgi:GT2 family glycosyltransferase